ncbi:MAG: penicillin-binding protein 1C [Gammaproteobacteria bacterium]|nr:penicillin-binding protein 1C [Gammaproteobacteria bacterium]
MRISRSGWPGLGAVGWGLLLLGALVCGAVGVGWARPSLAVAGRSLAAVRAAHPPSEARLLDRHGVVLQTLRTDLVRRRGPWVALADIAPGLQRTVIALEDRRFESHAGVDWWAVLGALRDGWHGRPRGASTLTMQLAARLDPALRARGARSLGQKWRQLQAALALERGWSKAEILEAYLNLASYRGEVAGVEAASRVLLGRAPAALDHTDALVLAVLLSAPNATLERLSARGCALGQRLPTRIDCAAFSARAHRALTPHAAPPGAAELAPQLARAALDGSTRNVSSTLDATVQRLARDSLQRQLALLAERNVGDGAVLVVENATGEVRAYVGNGAPWSSARHVDGVRARRQAGSTLKPFLYQLAIESRQLSAASLLNDSPLSIMTPGGLYVPQNYDHSFRGLVSLRTGLAGSLNVPAVRTLILLGGDSFLTRLRALGFTELVRDSDYYGDALALGAPEVSLWELVNAYRTLANAGQFTPLRWRPGPAAAPTATLDPAASFIVSDILADRGSRSGTFGLESALTLPFWAAVKTGTSKQMRDNWCIGYSTRYTVGVWVGNFAGEPMWEVSGLTGAAPIWAEVMRAVHGASTPSDPVAPVGLEPRELRFAGGLEPARREWFMTGTATSRIVAARAGGPPPRITYPQSGSVLALDPDIPAGHQRVFFSARPPSPASHWRLNGAPLGTSAQVAWAPAPGNYQLVLQGPDGIRLDQVQFKVQGAGPP